MTNEEDAQISALLRHHTGKALYSLPKKAKKLKDKYERDFKKMMKDRWSEKPMHGKFPNHLVKEYVGIQHSLQWMKHSGLKCETEGLITPAQDQALNTRYYNKHIIKEGHTDRCRMCS